VLGHGRLAHGQRVDELAHAALRIPQPVEDPTTGRFSEDGERIGGHPLNILLHVYACPGTFGRS
jgi:hypothetical protein